MDNIENKVITIIHECLKDEEIDIDTLKKDFKNSGINSINYIEIIVKIEENLNIEFKDEELDYSKFDSLDQFCGLIKNKMSEDK